MTIESYLADLNDELLGDPRFRRRVLAEVESHLREAAAAVGAAEAIARMGSPADLARGFAAQAAASAAAWAGRLVALCLAGFVGVYVAAENTLPPAPWPSEEATPALVRWTTDASTWAFALAAVAGVAAVALSVADRARAALGAASGAALALSVACALAVIGGIRRAALYEELDVSGRLSALETATGAAALVSLAAVALVSASWALRVWSTAERASRSYGLRS